MSAARDLLIGVELVRDLETKELLGKKVTELIFNECLKRGLVTMAYFPEDSNQPVAGYHRSAGRSGRRDPGRSLRARPRPR